VTIPELEASHRFPDFSPTPYPGSGSEFYISGSKLEKQQKKVAAAVRKIKSVAY